MQADYKQIDCVANRIIDIINEEIRGGASPVAVFAGQLGALVKFAETAPGRVAPLEFHVVLEAARVCLGSIENAVRS